MNNSKELRHLADSIAGLVATITEIINTKVQTATHDAARLQPPTTVQVASYDPWLTRPQLAAHLQVSLRTIENWRRQGYLPHYKAGRLVRYKLSDIQVAWEARMKRDAHRSW